MAVILGSSYFRPIGSTRGTGPTGPDGPTGPTGPTGWGVTGPTGHTGANITDIYMIGNNLHTAFTLWDGAAATTSTNVQGPTGASYITIDGGNTGFVGLGGATVYKETIPGESNENTITIRSIEVEGDDISLIQDESLDTINIHFERDVTGYANIASGTTGQFVGFKNPSGGDLELYGITGATYDTAVNSPDIKIKSFKELSKYFEVSDSDTSKDFYNLNSGGIPEYLFQGSINPNNNKTFVLDMNQLGSIADDDKRVLVEVQGATFGYTGNAGHDVKTLSKAFSLITHGATNSEQVNYRFRNVIWPYDREPCFSGETDIFNFYWLPCEKRATDPSDPDTFDICPDGVSWHGSVAQWKSEDTDMSTVDPFWCNEHLGEPANYKSGVVDYPQIHISSTGKTGSTGGCCMGDGKCIHTTSSLCRGYFMGSGSTCGSTGNTGSCYNEGPCCVYYETDNNVKCFDGLSVNECIDLGNMLNIRSYFGGVNLDCSDVYCDEISNEIGACCDGVGGCEYTNKTDCLSGGRYFLGVGSSCKLKDGIEVCSGGTGACCTSDDCIDGYSGLHCVDEGKIYAGHDTSCLDINCTSRRGAKKSNITSLNLQPGDIFGGGMVVGIYRPLGSVLHGNKNFSGSKKSSWQDLMMGATGSTSDLVGYTSDSYYSSYDYHGYGFSADRGCSEYQSLDNLSKDSLSDAYYIITSLSPIAITGDREVVNLNDYPGATQEFYWGNRGSSWGPVYNKNTNRFDDLNSSYSRMFNLSEGYWYIQGITGSVGNIPLYTFSSCKTSRRIGDSHIEKLLTKPAQSAHGLWHRNWGIHNNIRAISADNALSQGYGMTGAFTSDQFGPGLTASYLSAFRATRLLSDNLSCTGGTAGSTGGNIPQLSQWFIPSHDEMSFIAANCLVGSPYNFNLNSRLLAHDEGVPFDGWHWTSTGAFDNNKGFSGGVGEGIINISETETTADPGTLAWAMNFDINGNPNNFTFGKKNRTHQTYKVRPIRIIRSDGLYATGGHENEKLWRLPRFLRDSDSGINQN